MKPGPGLKALVLSDEAKISLMETSSVSMWDVSGMKSILRCIDRCISFSPKFNLICTSKVVVST